MKNDNKHKKVKVFLRVIGSLLIVFAGILEIIGISSFASAMENPSFEEPPIGYIFFIGAGGFLFIIGLSLLIFSLLGEIGKYSAKERVDVEKTYLSDIEDTHKEYARNITSGIKEGLKEEKTIKCPICGEETRSDSKFCDKCGCQLTKVCYECGNENDYDSIYCRKCGKKLQ